ncbi:MAG: BatD family protein [Alphaproteobacteria bacterium]|nr:BatD family protein [Alphaproteobacteria bacterium]
MSSPRARAWRLVQALLVLLAVLAVHPALAADPRLELVVDADRISVGQTVSAQVRLIDTVHRGAPELPVGKGLAATYRGQSSEVVVVNFESSRVTNWSFALTGLAEGTWTVGPVELQHGNQTLRADAVMVTVAPGEQMTVDGGAGVDASLSDEAPYLGEVVLYRFRHKHNDRVLDLDWTPPAFDGLIEEKTAGPDQQDSTVTDADGTWNLQEIVVPLVASQVGDHVVPPAVLTAKVPARDRGRRRPFLGSVELRTLSSKPIGVDVRPLPSDGRPRDFDGLVGQFQLTATLRERGGKRPVPVTEVAEVPLGESLTVEVVLRGNGTMAGVALPPPPSAAGYRVYDDAPEIQARVGSDGFQSVATFRRAVVPEAEGPLTIAPVELSAFDPEVGAFVTLRTRPIEVLVTPGEAGTGTVARFERDGDSDSAGGAEVAALGEDILPVSGGARVGDARLSRIVPLAVALPLLPAFGLVALGIDGLRRRRAPDPRADLRARLAALPAEPQARLAALEEAFREACGLRLGRPAPGLDRQVVTEGLGFEAGALYVDLERARYGGFSPGGDLEGRVRAFVEAT